MHDIDTQSRRAGEQVVEGDVWLRMNEKGKGGDLVDSLLGGTVSLARWVRDWALHKGAGRLEAKATGFFWSALPVFFWQGLPPDSACHQVCRGTVGSVGPPCAGPCPMMALGELWLKWTATLPAFEPLIALAGPWPSSFLKECQLAGGVCSLVPQRASDGDGVQFCGLLAGRYLEAMGDGHALGPLVLSHVGEEINSQTTRRKFGVFHTPYPVADYVAKRVLGMVSAREGGGGLHLLDPAVGGGVFLAAGASILAADLEGPTVEFHGVDISPLAVAASGVTLMSAYAKGGSPDRLLHVRPNIKQGNAILGRPHAVGVGGQPQFDWDAAFPQVLSSGGFDAVVGNPPYVALKAGDSEVVAWRDGLSSSSSKEYNGLGANAFSLFLARSVQLTREGGIIGLVLPRSLARVEGYAASRELVGKSCQVVEVVDLKRATTGVGYEQIALIMRKVNSSGRGRGRGGVVNVQLGLACGADGCHAFAPTLFGGHNPWPIGSSPQGLKLYGRLMKKGVRLDSKASIFRGLPLSVRDKEFSFRDQRQVGDQEEGFPILRGCDITRYCLGVGGWYSVANPQRKAKLEKARKRSLCKKLVLPNIVTSKIRANAAFDALGVSAFDTVTNVVVEDEQSLLVILACLNSSLGTYLLKEVIYGAGSLTVHADRKYLGGFPLPPPAFFQSHEAKDLACAAMALADAHQMPDCVERKMMEDRMDDWIAQVYDLSQGEKKAVFRLVGWGAEGETSRFNRHRRGSIG